MSPDTFTLRPDITESVARLADVFGKTADEMLEDILDAYLPQLGDAWSFYHLEVTTRTWDDEAECLENIPRIEAHIAHLVGQGNRGMPAGRFVPVAAAKGTPDFGRWEIRHVMEETVP